MNYGLSKSAEIVLSKSIFYFKNWRNSFKINQFSRPFFVKKTFFSTSIFQPLYFLKSCPIFVELAPPYSQNTMISFEYIDFWPKILLFRTHHHKNSTIELILVGRCTRNINNIQVVSSDSKVILSPMSTGAS